MLGVNFLRPLLASGAIDNIATTVLTDNDANFTAKLAGHSNLWVEISNGPGSGASSRIASFTNSTITTEEDLAGFATNQATYQIREAHTVSTVFGIDNNIARNTDPSSNEVGLLPGNVSTADIIWIPTSGGFIKVYYAVTAPPFTTAGWKNTAAGNADASNTPIYHTEAIFVERRGSTSLNLKSAGSVKTGPAILGITTGMNFLNRVFPFGVSLQDSGLGDYLTHGNASTADIVWMPNGSGNYDKYYYALPAPPFTTAGWKSSNTGNLDKGGAILTTGFILERKGGAANVLLISKLPGEDSE